MSHVRRSEMMIFTAVWMTVVVTTSACATAGARPDELQRKFGTIAVAADEAATIHRSFNTPMTSRRQAMEAASSKFSRKYGQEVQKAMFDPRVILVLPLIPIVGIVGFASSSIYGAAAAESPDAVEAGAAALHRAVDDLDDVSRELRDSVIAQFAKRGSYHSVVAYDPALGEPAESIKTLIRVSVASIELGGGGGVNPGLTLRVDAALSAFQRDAENVWRAVESPGIRHLSSATDGPKFLRWAADDAFVFKRKVRGELNDLAKKIVNGLFKDIDVLSLGAQASPLLPAPRLGHDAKVRPITHVVPSVTPNVTDAAIREHCRQLHLMRSDWRHYLPAYERCLAR